jgi:hypothetical protein
MKQIIVHQDLEKIAQLAESLKSALPLLQMAWDAYRETDFFDPKTSIGSLIANMESLKMQYKLSLIRAEHTTIAGLRLNEIMAAKLYEVRTPALDAAVTQCLNLFNASGIKADFFSIEADRVAVNEAAYGRAVEKHSEIARTDLEIQMYKLFTAHSSSAVKVNSFLKENGIDVIFLNKLHPIMLAQFYVMKEDGTYEMNPLVFKRLAKQLARHQQEVEKI